MNSFGYAMLLFAVVLVGSLLSGPAQAASTVDIYSFDTPAQQARYKALTEEFRCPKCLNTNIAGSDAPIAQDLRRTVHKLVVVDGYTDQQVRDFLQERYGDFVLYSPPFTGRTALIWVMPVLLALVGLIALFGLLRRARRSTTVELDPADQTRLQAILRED